MLHEEVVDDGADVGGQQLAFVRAGGLGAHLLGDLLALQQEDAVLVLLAFLVALDDIFALLDGRDGGGIGRRAADAELLELMHERGLGVALRSDAVALGGADFAACQLLALAQRRQHVGKLVGCLLLVLVVLRLAIDFQETVELDDLAGGDELTIDH